MFLHWHFRACYVVITRRCRLSREVKACSAAVRCCRVALSFVGFLASGVVQ
jgi:hypothetical protein